jgi:hypothetical protein
VIRLLLMLALALSLAFGSASDLLAKGGSRGGSKGGHYSGGKGSSHKGGQYTPPYGRRYKKYGMELPRGSTTLSQRSEPLIVRGILLGGGNRRVNRRWA